MKGYIDKISSETTLLMVFSVFKGLNKKLLCMYLYVPVVAVFQLTHVMFDLLSAKKRHLYNGCIVKANQMTRSSYWGEELIRLEMEKTIRKV